MSMFDKVKAAAQAVADKAGEWASASLDKIKETVDALTASAVELPRVGYRLTDLELELSLLPRVIVCLERDREAHEEEFQALLATKRDSSTFTVLVKLLQQANAMDRRLKPRDRRLTGLRVELGVPPVLNLRYSEPAVVTAKPTQVDRHEDY